MTAWKKEAFLIGAQLLTIKWPALVVLLLLELRRHSSRSAERILERAGERLGAAKLLLPKPA
jgi:hypothetical protein